MLRLTEEALAEINARNKARLIRRGNWQEPVDPPKPPGRPKIGEGAEARRQEKRRKHRAAGEVTEYKTSAGEAMLIQHLNLAGITGWQREYLFKPGRRWRLDFAWPDPIRLAVEIEGGSWTNGRHTRGTGFAKDCEKYNALTLTGWKLLRYTPEMVKKGIALAQIQAILGV